MREIYTSPRAKNIDLVVALFAEHGIETRVTNRAVYDRPSYTRFSYGPREDSSNWARVEVKYARDMTRAKDLLRSAGVKPMNRYADELEYAPTPRHNKRPRRSITQRFRTALLAILAAALVVLFLLKMTGIG